MMKCLKKRICGVLIMIKLLQRYSRTSASPATTRQPAFPRNTSSRSTFHSGQTRPRATYAQASPGDSPHTRPSFFAKFSLRGFTKRLVSNSDSSKLVNKVRQYSHMKPKRHVSRTFYIIYRLILFITNFSCLHQCFFVCFFIV